MNSNPKITIIIPVFRVERYIRQCLQSVLLQSYRNFECIIVDDGSPDQSLRIAKDTVGDDNRFVIISQPNRGVSVARNIGIENATGDFIIFIDSDDYVLDGYLETIAALFYSNNLSIDALVFNHSLLKDDCNYNERERYRICFDGIVYKDDALTLFLDGVIGLSSWGMVFRRSVLDDLRFSTSLNVAEDALFVAHYLMRCRNLLLSEKSFYVYRQDSSGVTKSGFSEKKLRSAQVAFSEIEKIYLANSNFNDPGRLYVFIFRHLLGHVFSSRYLNVNKSQFKYFFYVLKKIRASDFTSYKHLLAFLYCKYWLRFIL